MFLTVFLSFSAAVAPVTSCSALHPHWTPQLPSFPHVSLESTQFLVGLVEDLELMAAPASPDTQAPLHVWLQEATYDRVTRHQSCLLQGPSRKRRTEREDNKEGGEGRGEQERASWSVMRR